ncbi:MAG: hypothetical protein H6732_17895 [Alphaproteobacteria bacterium]|nr:hypothetical protein [Alphaproteobacteria bacterium]
MDRRLGLVAVAGAGLAGAVALMTLMGPATGEPLDAPAPKAKAETVPEAAPEVAEVEAEAEADTAPPEEEKPTLEAMLRGEAPKPPPAERIWRPSYNLQVGSAGLPAADLGKPLPVGMRGITALFQDREERLRGCLREHGPARSETKSVVIELTVVPDGAGAGRVAGVATAFLQEPERFPDLVPCVQGVVGDAVFEAPEGEQKLQLPIYRKFR